LHISVVRSLPIPLFCLLRFSRGEQLTQVEVGFDSTSGGCVPPPVLCPVSVAQREAYSDLIGDHGPDGVIPFVETTLELIEIAPPQDAESKGSVLMPRVGCLL